MSKNKEWKEKKHDKEWMDIRREQYSRTQPSEKTKNEFHRKPYSHRKG